MDLFSDSLQSRFDEFAPLAARMRPSKLEDFVGQEHLLGSGSPLRVLIERDALTSLILWGPPGTGKTSLANIVATATKARYVELSAVSATVVDVRRTINEAKDILAGSGRKTVLFIDEIHRFNKGQQDTLLPAVENRWVSLIGATTENPYFELNSPLLSRCLLIRLETLSPEQIEQILRRALADREQGLAGRVEVQDGAFEHIVRTSGGDARSALNALEVCVAAAEAEGGSKVTLALAEMALQRRQVRYDKAGDQHFDVASAFIKSMRGSDPDAALFWMARMLEAGEDPRFIARRIVIAASEDVGNADPMALVVAVAAAQALEHVGLPEARLSMAQAAMYVALAAKSNSALSAIGRASDAVAGASDLQVPGPLRSHFSRKDRKADRVGYKNPHDHPGGWVEQNYLPKGSGGAKFFEPIRGREAEMSEQLAARKKRKPG
ncbi:MAG: replication-associated recombination protein A [Actinomycetota bacterium]